MPLVSLGLLACAGSAPPTPPPAQTAPPPDPPAFQTDAPCTTLAPIYNTKGVHSPCFCGEDGCVEKRKPGEPPDPQYPPHWVSEWTMYRVYANYEDNLPPWSNPPAGLTEGQDYEASKGATYYDSAYVPASGNGHGAMMEHYDKRCLPIFPIANDFTCSFISLGNTAYFLTYEEDRPEGMPPCCLFSPYNHPPRRDFASHLPYSAEDSSHLDDSLQAYRYVAPGPGGSGIWFAYAFEKGQYLDPEKKYLKPQSFYFSGQPTSPPNAPFVSQNYENFRIEMPVPDQTWDLVAQMCPADEAPPPCQLFDPPCENCGAEAVAPKWTQIERQPKP